MTKRQCYFTERQARRIEAYADAHEISFAEALRRILDQLLFTNSRGGDDLGLVKSPEETKSPEEELIMKYVSVLQQKWSEECGGEDNNEPTSNT